MQEKPLEIIRQSAISWNDLGDKWHFHLLTPTCFLNVSDKYAFVVENIDTGEVLVHYSDQSEKEVGAQLAPLLHGETILTETHGDAELDSTQKEVVEKAKNCNENNLPWHHHVLFPGCQFNETPQKFTFLFESETEEGGNVEAVESITDFQPTALLEHIEKYFYQV